MNGCCSEWNNNNISADVQSTRSWVLKNSDLEDDLRNTLIGQLADCPQVPEVLDIHWFHVEEIAVHFIHLCGHIKEFNFATGQYLKDQQHGSEANRYSDVKYIHRSQVAEHNWSQDYNGFKSPAIKAFLAGLRLLVMLNLKVNQRYVWNEVRTEHGVECEGYPGIMACANELHQNIDVTP